MTYTLMIGLFLTVLSLERIQQYLVIDQEPKPTEQGVTPAHWPSSGELRVEKLSARYSQVGYTSIARHMFDESTRTVRMVRMCYMKFRSI